MSAAPELCYLEAGDLARRIGAKQLSPVEVVVNALARRGETEPHLNAFAAHDDEAALHAAREAERIVLAGEPLGPLHDEGAAR